MEGGRCDNEIRARQAERDYLIMTSKMHPCQCMHSHICTLNDIHLKWRVSMLVRMQTQPDNFKWHKKNLLEKFS